MSDWRQAAQVAQRRAVAVQRSACAVDADGRGVAEASCRPVVLLAEPGAIDLEQLDVDDHLGPRLVDGGG